MAKKSSGKHYTSKGERSSVASSTLNAIRRDTCEGDKLKNIQTAYWKGQNPWITIDNRNREETNKRKTRVKANVLWLAPKERLKKN